MLVGCNTLSFSTGYNGDFEALKRLAAAGFDAVDYNLNKFSVRDPVDKFWTIPDAERACYTRNLKSLADSLNLKFSQVHSPYPTYFSDNKKRSQVFEISMESIRIAAMLMAPYIVVHPNVPPEKRTVDEVKALVEDNIVFFSKFIPHLKSYGIKLAIENMFNWDWDKDIPLPTVASSSVCMAYMVDKLNAIAKEELFVACLDVGHAVLTGDSTPDMMVRTLGSRLKLLHIHDNDAKRDRHYIPFTGVVDWSCFVKALFDIGYQGALSLEIKNQGTADDALNAFNAINKLRNMLEEMC